MVENYTLIMGDTNIQPYVYVTHFNDKSHSVSVEM